MRKVFILAAALLPLLSCYVRADDRPALGIVMSDQIPEPSGGVAVTGILSNSPAAQAGLQPGDRIVAMNGQSVSDYRDAMRIVAASDPGSKVSLDIVRGDWRATRTAYLGRHQQVFQGQSVFHSTTVVPTEPAAVRVIPWRQPASPQFRTHPRNDLWTSLGNSDG
jgi:membrane-associated protease RseP (regulator of RpoE activity)